MCGVTVVRIAVSAVRAFLYLFAGYPNLPRRLTVTTRTTSARAYRAPAHGPDTDTSRGAAHRYLEQTLAPSQYTVPAHQPGAPRLRLLTFAVSVRGALGSEAQTFIRQLSARVAGAVPYRLLDEASWATQGCAPLLRSAITFSARRALAAGIRRSTCSGAEAAYVVRGCDDQPAPDPARCFDWARLTRLLLSSDLLRVAAWVAVGLCLDSFCGV